MRFRMVLLIAVIFCAILAAGCVSEAEQDKVFRDKTKTMTQEISPILKDYAAKANAKDYSGLKTAATSLSTRARFWYDTLDAVSVSTSMEDAKRLILLSLEEAESAGDLTVKSIQRRDSGDISGSVALLQEATQHTTKSGSYMTTAIEKLPGKTG